MQLCQEWESFSKIWDDDNNPGEASKVIQAIVSHSAEMRRNYSDVREQDPYRSRAEVSDELAEFEEAYRVKTAAYDAVQAHAGPNSALEKVMRNTRDAYNLIKGRTGQAHGPWLHEKGWAKVHVGGYFDNPKRSRFLAAPRK